MVWVYTFLILTSQIKDWWSFTEIAALEYVDTDDKWYLIMVLDDHDEEGNKADVVDDDKWYLMMVSDDHEDEEHDADVDDDDDDDDDDNW